ncbi:MAG: dUTP diphosphatase [Gammaproteobacteria bacterium]|nr:dUTP diphosphatase [Gammaproteobacteria bacterium]
MSQPNMTREEAMAMVRTMAEMQNAHNVQVHPEWRSQGYEYYRAIWVECAELLDHFGWKWWKKQVVDLDQVKLEIVDIWHFGLSDLMRADKLDESVGEVMFAVENNTVNSLNSGDVVQFRAAVETLAESSLSQQVFQVGPFQRVLETLPMSLTELFRLYIGKNVLNNFRQDHGYKTGEYEKLWSGREDNEHLIEILEELDCAVDEVPQALYGELSGRYPG